MQENIIIFDDSIRRELHALVTQRQEFFVDKDLKRTYQLVCVMNDRLADAIAYLNQHSENAPKTLARNMVSCLYGEHQDCVKGGLIGKGNSKP